MPEVNIFVRLKDEASKGLEGLGGNLGKLGAGFVTLGAVGAAAIAGIGMAAGKLAYDAAMVEPIKITFDNLTKSIDSTANSMLLKLRPAAMGTLSDLQLMQGANKLMAMGLADSEDQAAKLTNMAIRLGTAMGVDATTAMENFTLMLANQSIPRLDTFGISSGQVRLRIEELQKATEGMTREEAFMIAVMEQGEESLGKIGDISETSAVKMAGFRATMSNLKDTIGTALLPVFNVLIDKALMPLAEKATAIVGVFQEFLPQAFAEFGRALSGEATDWEGVSAILLTIFGEEMGLRLTELLDTTLMPAFRTIADFLQNQLIPVIQTHVIPTLQNLGGFILELAAAALPILLSAIQFVVDHWQIFAAIAAAVGLVIVALQAPIALIVGAILLLATAWANNWGGIQDKVRAVWEFLKPIFETIGSVFNWFVTEILPLLKEAFSTAWAFIQETVTAAWEGFKPHLEELQEVLREFWEVMKPRLEEAWAAIQEAMSKVAAWVAETLIPKLQELWDRLEPVREKIVELAGKFGDFMGSAFITGLKTWLSAIIGLWDGMSTAISTVVGWIGTLLDWIGRALDRLRELASALGGAGGGGGVEPGRGMAPGLQGGLAYVPATMPAIIHQGEAVLTREQAARWRMGQGGPDIHIHMSGDMFGISGVNEAVQKVIEETGRYAV